MPVRERLHSVRWRALIVIAFSAGVLAYLLLYPTGAWPIYRVDFDVYRTGGRTFLDGLPLYDGTLILRDGYRLNFTYPPLAAVLFSGFALLPLWLGSALLTALSMALLVVTLRLVLVRLVRWEPGEVWWLALAIAAGCLWLQPVGDTLTYGQVNIALMFLVVLDVTAGRGRRWAGVGTGLAMAIKLTPAVFVLYFLLRRDWRAAATSVGAALGFTAIGHVLTPADSSRYWTTTLFTPERIGGLAFSQNQSLRGELARLHLDSGVLWLGIAALVVALIAWVAGRLIGSGADLAALCVVAFASLFGSPVSWDQHWVWAVLLMVILAVGAVTTVDLRGVWLPLVVVGVVVMKIVPHKRIPNRGGAELGWTTWQHLVGSSYLLWGLATLVLLGVFARRIPADLDPGDLDPGEGESDEPGASTTGSVAVPARD